MVQIYQQKLLKDTAQETALDVLILRAEDLSAKNKYLLTLQKPLDILESMLN